MATFRFKRLTLRQREVFDFIEKFIAEAVYPPTIREIGKAFGFSEKAAFDYVAVLVRKGMLERRADDTPRNIKLTPFSQLFSWKAQADIQPLGVQKGDVLTVSPAASPVVGDRVLTTHGTITAFQDGQQIVGKVVGLSRLLGVEGTVKQ